jgi:hypothetical protein
MAGRAVAGRTRRCWVAQTRGLKIVVDPKVEFPRYRAFLVTPNRRSANRRRLMTMTNR